MKSLGQEPLALGRGDDAHVDLDRPGLTQWVDLARVEQPEQLRLYVQVQLTDFVEEQRSALGGADDAGGMVLCAREGATPVSEEVAVEDVARHPLAVVRNKGPVGASGMVVNGAREQFFGPVPVSPPIVP